MKIALISDLHACPIQLEAVLADIGSTVDRIVCLGDLMDLGPRPRELIARIRELGIACVEGNHDALDTPPLPPPEINAWCRGQLGPDERAYLGALPPTLRIELPGNKTLLCAHGSPRSFDDEILATTPSTTLEAWIQDADDVVAVGHTHVQLVRRLGHRTIINAGSVAQPFFGAFDGVNPPSIFRWSEYAVLHASKQALSVELRRATYDFDAFATDVRACGMPDPERYLRTWRA